MKTTANFILFIIATGIFFSCQKPFAVEEGLTSAGIIAKDSAGNCTPVNINGLFKAGVLLNATNYIDVSVNVTATGNYTITTNNVNGIYFSDTAVFTTTGIQTVRLTGHGTPITAGVFTFTAHYNNSSSCAVQLTVSPAGTTVASFTLTGAPGACTTPDIQGTYTAGTILDPSNKIIISVNVTGPGDYNLTTGPVNGISFSAIGTFSSLGNQPLTLSGTGTPISAGTNSMSISGAVAGCSFPLTVGSITSAGNYLAAAFMLDTTLTAPFDTIGRYYMTYDAQNRVSTIAYMEFETNGDSAYYSLRTLFYNGNDSFANRVTDNFRDYFPTTPGVSTRFYSFSNGKCILDSLTYPSGNYYTHSFVYNGNNVQKTIRTFASGVFAYGYANIARTFVNGNNTYQLDTSVTYTNISNPNTYNYVREEVTTTYLSNPNPFYQVFKAILRPNYADDIGITSGAAPKNLMAQHNEHMIMWNASNPPIFNQLDQLSFTYTFRPDGYPLVARHTRDRNGVITKGKLVFVYR